MRIAFAIGLTLPMLGHAACKVQALELPVKMTGPRAVATVVINGTTVPLAVDSGAFFSFLTEAAAAQLKLPLKRNFGLRVEGVTGMVDTYTTRVDSCNCWKGNCRASTSLSAATNRARARWGCWGATSCRSPTPNTTWRMA